MVDNEMLILVYETLQSLSSGVKDMKSTVQALNIKIEAINKRVSDIEDVVNGVINPGIMTIGEGHEAVHKRIYDTESSLSSEMKNTKEALADELKATQKALEKEVKESRENLNSGLSRTRKELADYFEKEKDELDSMIAGIKKDHSDISSRFEVFELKQQRMEQALKSVKRLH